MWLQFYQSLQPEKITDKFLWGRLEPLLGYLTDEQKSKVLEALHLAYDSHHGQVGAFACGIILCHEVSQSQHWYGCCPHAVHGCCMLSKAASSFAHVAAAAQAVKTVTCEMLIAGAVVCRHAKVGNLLSPIQWR